MPRVPVIYINHVGPTRYNQRLHVCHIRLKIRIWQGDQHRTYSVTTWLPYNSDGRGKFDKNGVYVPSCIPYFKDHSSKQVGSFLNIPLEAYQYRKLCCILVGIYIPAIITQIFYSRSQVRKPSSQERAMATLMFHPYMHGPVRISSQSLTSKGLSMGHPLATYLGPHAK